MCKIDKIFALLVLPVCLWLSGCADTSSLKTAQQDEYLNKVVLNQIKVSTSSIQHSLENLNAIELSKYGQPKMPFKQVKSEDLSKDLSITWYGPIEPLLKQIAHSVGYKVETFGKQPLFPVVILLGNLNAPVNDSALNILTNIAVQAKAKAVLSINTKMRVISIRYVD